MCLRARSTALATVARQNSIAGGDGADLLRGGEGRLPG
jgi:hypothetical protein